jgi:hypothetical protein
MTSYVSNNSMVLIPYHELLLSFYDYFMDFKFADQFQMVYFLHIDIYIYIYIYLQMKKKNVRDSIAKIRNGWK